MATLDIRGVVILLDDEDIELVSRYKWWISPQGYACTHIRRENGTRRTIGMHRLILGDPNMPAIDHINRNKLDNRKCNLRACSDSENSRNKKIVNGKTSAYRGVSFKRGKWQVVIRVNGVLKWLGYHKTEKEAAKIAAPYFSDIAA